jgi:hypothetical protein
LVSYTIRLVELLAQFECALSTWAVWSLWAVLLFYTILFAWTFARPDIRQRWLGSLSARRPALTLALLTCIGLLSVVVWQAALSAPDGRLHLTLLDVGSGDALLIQTPTGRAVLVDGGPSANRLGQGLGRRLPLGYRQLDYLLVAGVGEEQLAALPRTIERFPPERVLWSGPPAGTLIARQLRQALGTAHIPALPAETGQILDLGQGHLACAGGHPARMVLLLEWGNFRALLPVGLDFDTLEALLSDLTQPPVTALLLAESAMLAHHPRPGSNAGVRRLSCSAWLLAITRAALTPKHWQR